MKKKVSAHTFQIADTVRLDVPVGADLVGVARAPHGITVFSLGLAEQEKTCLRYLRVIMSGVEFDADGTAEYVGSVTFGANEAYHVFEIPPPDRGERERRIGL